MSLLQVNNLSVSFTVEGRQLPAVRDVSFEVKRGEIVGLVGESGSGKSVTGMSIMRLIPQPPGSIDSGEVFFNGVDLLKQPIEEIRKLRGTEISVIFQEPMTALSPLHPVGKQLAEAVRIHSPETSKKEAWAIGVDWLDKVGIPDPKARSRAYPFQFSGGMRQRVMIAMALILQPKLIIADEPTTALDVTIQAQIFDLIMRMKSDETSVIFITHDMGVIWELADRVLVMRDSRIVERGTAEALFANPQEEYTKKLLSTVPRLTDRPIREWKRRRDDVALISVRDLKTWFPVKRGVFARTVDHVKAVDGVSLDIMPGETLGLVGESGSGKSTLGRTILGLDEATEGSIRFRTRELTTMNHHELRPLRRNLQMIFQDPFSSLNPRMTVLDILTEGLKEHRMLKGDAKEAAAESLKEVGLEPDHMNRYAHEFSGGQRQRICIARAIAVKPEFIVCDEAVSALDVTIQAQVIDLLMELREKFHLSYLFISHDLSVVKRICDRVIVLKSGRIVEQGKGDELVSDPKKDYTRRLISAVPVPGDPAKRRKSA